MIYLVSWDYGPNEKHAYYDLVEANSVPEAVQKWQEVKFNSDKRPIGCAAVPKHIYDDYKEFDTSDKWYAAHDAIRDLSDTLAKAVGTYEERR